MVAMLKPQTAIPSIQSMVDEFAELHQQIKTLEPMLKRYEQLKKQLADHANSLGDGEVKLTGQFGYATFSKPSVTRTVRDPWQAFAILGADNFVQCATLSVTKVDKLLTPTQKAELFEVSTGARRLKDAGTIAGLLLASAGITGSGKATG